MMTTSEKVAYLKGLTEGLGVDKESKEGKILASILDILGEMATDIEDLDQSGADMGDAIDQVSDDLADIEDIVYGGDDEDDDEDGDWDGDDECDPVCCSRCKGGADDEPVFYEVTCPKCGNTITIDEDVLDLGAIECPNCGEKLEFDGIIDEDSGEDSVAPEDDETPPEKE